MRWIPPSRIISPSSAPRARQPASANPKVFGSHSVATNEKNRKTVGPPKQVPTTDVFFSYHTRLAWRGRARRRETILRSSIELINRWQHEAAVQSQGRRPTRREAAQGGRAQPALSARSHFFSIQRYHGRTSGAAAGANFLLALARAFEPGSVCSGF